MLPSYDSQADLTLFAESGNEAAFRRLVTRYGALVLNSARRRVADEGMAEEIAQDVFATLARKAAKVAHYQSLAAWLYETTKRQAAQVHRSQSRHRRKVQEFATEPSSAMTSDEHARELRELRPFLEDALGSLKTREREILFARLFEERSFREISSSCGKSESACKMAMSRALTKLQEFLKARGVTFSIITLASLLQSELARGASMGTLESMASGSLLKAQYSPIFRPLEIMNHSKTLVVASLAILTIAGILIVRQSPPETAEQSGAKPQQVHSSSNTVTTSSMPSRQRSRRSATQANETEQTHSPQDLKEFHLPAMTIENASLAEAVEIVLAKYGEVCRDTGEVELPLHWELSGEGVKIEKIQLQGDLVTVCRKLALFTDTAFELDGTLLRFTDIPDGPVATRQWTAPPAFETYLPSVFESEIAVSKTYLEIDPQNVVLPDDLPNPFGEGPILRVETADFSDLLRAAGILGAGEMVSFFSSSGSIEVTGSSRALSRMDTLVSMASDAFPRQVRYYLKRGVDGVSTELPTVVALPGQSATVEVGKEYIELRGDELPEVFVGTQVFFGSELYGLSERTTVSFSIIGEPTEEDLAVYQKTGRLDDLKLEEFKVEDQVTIRTTEQRIEEIATEFHKTDSNGSRLSFQYLSERIDATGRRVFEKPGSDAAEREESGEGE